MNINGNGLLIDYGGYKTLSGYNMHNDVILSMYSMISKNKEDK